MEWAHESRIRSAKRSWFSGEVFGHGEIGSQRIARYWGFVVVTRSWQPFLIYWSVEGTRGYGRAAFFLQRLKVFDTLLHYASTHSLEPMLRTGTECPASLTSHFPAVAKLSTHHRVRNGGDLRY